MSLGSLRQGGTQGHLSCAAISVSPFLWWGRGARIRTQCLWACLGQEGHQCEAISHCAGMW